MSTRTSIFSRLSAASPDWSSRTYGGTTTILLWLISADTAHWDLSAHGSGPTFLAAGEAALKDAREKLDKAGAKPYAGGTKT